MAEVIAVVRKPILPTILEKRIKDDRRFIFKGNIKTVSSTSFEKDGVVHFLCHGEVSLTYASTSVFDKKLYPQWTIDANPQIKRSSSMGMSRETRSRKEYELDLSNHLASGGSRFDVLVWEYRFSRSTYTVNDSVLLFDSENGGLNQNYRNALVKGLDQKGFANAAEIVNSVFGPLEAQISEHYEKIKKVLA